MELRNLGASELRASVVGLGTNNFGMRCDLDQSAAVVHAALDAGITFFDTADMYGGGKSEEFLGKALANHRNGALIATKFGGDAFHAGKRGFGRPAAIVESIDASLKRLGCDHIDLYQMHYPDAETPIAETIGALRELIQAGKVRAVGHSNFEAAGLREADDTFVSAQNEWNLLQRDVEAEVIPACESAGISQIPYYPLASGLLTGKYKRGEPFAEGTRLAAVEYFASVATEENFDKVEKLQAVASDAGRPLLDLAFSWLAAQPSVASIIAGATKPAQVAVNARAADWKLGESELEAINEAAA